jgi:Nucleotidyl transferase AbiEii toxin, Type IV TA system
MKSTPGNMAASVRDRLKALARTRGENFDLMLVRYGIERLLYRLSRSPWQKNYVLKGAMLFTVWEGALHRETRDLDLIGFGDSSVDGLVENFRAICAVTVPDDGLVFGDVRGEPIQALQDYGGARLTVLARLIHGPDHDSGGRGLWESHHPAGPAHRISQLVGFPRATAARLSRGDRRGREAASDGGSGAS